ncbi:hypothetical protein BUALT_Bualt17G0108300 [Buddleja alternifolia]|uniref:Uncharacterized protein n=1 Tax=Buddleja alternifolia TaxID=168488 RepID=A0AAV6W5H5_9LAMI|nr:hypothetical protein BUALT_Bualt17G0108300 [Buddleja alternifolia]
MPTKLHKLLSTLLFLSTVLQYPATTTSQGCPYPCYPPPTGPGNNPPVTTTPPASTTPPTSFSPPVGVYPFTPPAPYTFGAAPPPPEPIVPWFPYYYRKPPHQDQSSSSSPLKQSTNVAIMFLFVVFTLFFTN